MTQRYCEFPGCGATGDRSDMVQARGGEWLCPEDAERVHAGGSLPPEAPRDRLVSLTVTRHEGPAAMGGHPWTFGRVDHAEAKLREWQQTAPRGGGYDKCTVQVVADGDQDRDPVDVTFRLDLTHSPAPLDLRAFLRQVAGFYSGQARPPWMDPQQYAQALAASLRDPKGKPFKLACENLWSRLQSGLIYPSSGGPVGGPSFSTRPPLFAAVPRACRGVLPFSL